MVANAKVFMLVVVVALALTFDVTEARKPLPFVGEVRWMSFQFAPDGWILCDGKEHKASDFPRLVKVIGKQFGGDGKTTFNVPNLTGGKVGTAQSKDIGKMYPVIAASGVYPVRHYT